MTVEERLAQIERKVDRTFLMMEALSEKVQEQTAAQNEWRDRISRTIYGHNGTPGNLVRIDRLEQTQDRQKWLVRSIVGAVIALAAAAMHARIGS